MSLRTTYSSASWRGWSAESNSSTGPYNFAQMLPYSTNGDRGLDSDLTGDTIILSRYIFYRTNGVWALQSDLGLAVESACISSDGNTVIVGVPTDSTLGANAGAAYMFTRSAGVWTQASKFYGSTTAAGDNFGREVFITGDGNTIVVNGPFNDVGGANTGAVYTFTRSGSSVSQQSVLNTRRMRAMNGNATVGLFTPSTSDTTRYLYRRTTGAWSLSTAPSENGPNVFGFDDNGNRYIAGWSTADTDGLTNNGLVYYNQYNGTSWSSAVTIQPNEKVNNQGFGYSLEFDDAANTMIVSASAAGGNKTILAGLYVFTRDISGNYIDNGRLITPDGRFMYPTSGISISGNGNVIAVNSYEATASLDGLYIFTK